MWIRFSACAAESAASTSDCTRDFERLGDYLERSATWRGKHFRSRVWVQRFKKGGWTKRLSGAVISETFPQDPWLESIGFVGDTLVSPSAKRASGQGKTTRDTCGLPSSSLFGAIDPPACCSRTSRAISRWGCGTSCPIWKQAATERRGAATRRRLSALHIDASGSLSSGWPTPRASTGGADPHSRKTGKNLQHAVNWPTPTVTANQTAPSMRKHLGCRAFWPTPMTRDHKDGSATYDVPTNGLLGRAAPRDPTSHPGQLNPDWVEMLMGFPVGWTDCAPSETQ